MRFFKVSMFLLWAFVSALIAFLVVAWLAPDVDCPARMTAEECGRYRGEQADAGTTAIVFAAWAVIVVVVPLVVARYRKRHR